MDLKEFIEQRAKILVVDDVPSARKVVSRLLNKIGIMDIIEADTGEKALEHLSSGEIQLVISDWNMPAMDGLALLEQIRKSDGMREVPFILITSSADRDEVVHAYNSGISDYIVKPFNGEILGRKVESVIARLSTRN